MFIIFRLDAIEVHSLVFRSIYQMFSYSDQDTKDNMTGIQILGVILTNGFEPHCTKSSVDEEKYALILNILWNKFI